MTAEELVFLIRDLERLAANVQQFERSERVVVNVYKGGGVTVPRSFLQDAGATLGKAAGLLTLVFNSLPPPVIVLPVPPSS